MGIFLVFMFCALGAGYDFFAWAEWHSSFCLGFGVYMLCLCAWNLMLGARD